MFAVKPFCVTITHVESKRNKKTNGDAEARKNQSAESGGKRRKVNSSLIGLLSLIVLGILFVVALAFAFFYAQAGKSTHALWWGVASAICATVGVGLYIQQHILWAKREPPERPIVFVERVVARPLVAGHRKAVSVQLRNRGSRPARKITAWINHAFTKADFEGPLKFARIYEPDTRSDCEPTAAISLAGKSDSPVALWEIKALNDKKAFWFVYGKGTYEDDSGNIYHFDWCSKYEPGMGEDMVICPDRFLPKEETELRPQYPVKRPELSLELAQVFFNPGKAAKVQILLRNRGKITAHKIELAGAHYLEPITFKGPLERIVFTETDSYPNLAPEAQMVGTTYGGEALTFKDIADIEDRTKRFYHYSIGSYEDAEGTSFPLEFCFMYEPALGSPNGLHMAPRKYWPQKNTGGHDKSE